MSETLVQQRYVATDLGAAAEAVREVFGVGVGVPDVDADGLHYQQRSLVDDGISVTQIASAGASVRLWEVATPDLVVIAVREGALELVHGADVVTLGAGELGLIPLGASVEMRWNRVTLNVFSFTQSSVARLMGATHDGVRLRTPRLTPRSSKIAGLWLRLAELLAEHVLEDPEFYERDQIREHMIDALLGTTIEAFDVSNADEDDPAAVSSALQRAEAFMRTHLHDPISVPDIARAAGISVRGLQLASQRALATSPLIRLRDLRLAFARRALSQAEDRSTTVSAEARRVGYTNLGRFSAHYRSAFGESPSATLRRAPGEQAT